MKVAVVCAVALLEIGCGIRPLTSAELYGSNGRGGASGSGGGGTNAGGGGGGAAGGSTGGVGGGRDGGEDGRGPDGLLDASTGDGPDSGCAQPCAVDQFCDELTGHCAPTAGAGMLSGIVSDACSGAGLAALVGIAGQHACSYQFKGSYFLTGLPLGMLKLAAAKTGYELYGDTVEILPGGVVHDIHLARVGGCTAPAPPDNACTCTASSCTPP